MNWLWNSLRKVENNEIHLVKFLLGEVGGNDDVVGIREQIKSSKAFWEL